MVWNKVTEKISNFVDFKLFKVKFQLNPIRQTFALVKISHFMASYYAQL